MFCHWMNEINLVYNMDSFFTFILLCRFGMGEAITTIVTHVFLLVVLKWPKRWLTNQSGIPTNDCFTGPFVIPIVCCRCEMGDNINQGMMRAWNVYDTILILRCRLLCGCICHLRYETFIKNHWDFYSSFAVGRNETTQNQVAEVYKRTLIMYRREPVLTKVRLAQTVIVALLVGLIFLQLGNSQVTSQSQFPVYRIAQCDYFLSWHIGDSKVTGQLQFPG